MFLKKKTCIWIMLALTAMTTSLIAKDSLPALMNGSVPQNVDDLWAGYNPRAEALDVKIIHEWDETYQGQELKVQMLTFTVGTFKGKVSRISAYYAYPADAKGKVPGLVQVHGGGQRADKNTVKADAANGYASISLNWGGRELADQKPGEPGTDWAAIDPTQKHVSHYFRLTPDDRTAETVYSPRNNNWFILTLATRRGLTFLEQQSVVDADRLGVYGHSMGGTISGQIAGLDQRIKAAVPSCGGAGISQAKNIARPGSSLDQRVGDKRYSKTVDSTASLRNLKFPILGQSPQNDFNCIYDDLNHNWRVIPDHSLVHFSISPHLNHRHVAESAFTRIRFFNAFLKGDGVFPARPELTVSLKASNGIPVASVKPDLVDQVQRVQIYYSINPHSLTRFWRRAETIREGDHWQARLPIISSAMPLFVMANVEYPQPRPLIGPPHLAKSPPTFLVSSWEKVFDPPALKVAGVKATDHPERMIQERFDDWGDWYRMSWKNTHHALAGTRKLTDPKWRGPDGASLSIDVKDSQGGNFLMTFDVNNWGAYANLKKSVYYCVKPLAKTDDWQTVTIALSDLKPRKAGISASPTSWQGITDLAIVAGIHRLLVAPKTILSGGTWPGKRQLRNLRWTGGSYTAPLLYPGGRLSVEEFQKIFQEDIDRSIELEKQDAKQGATAKITFGVGNGLGINQIAIGYTPFHDKNLKNNSFTTTSQSGNKQVSLVTLSTAVLKRALENKLGTLTKDQSYKINAATLTAGVAGTAKTRYLGGNDGTVHLMATRWNSAKATFNNADSRVKWASGGSFSAADYNAEVVTTGKQGADSTVYGELASILQSWLDGADNKGLAFTPSNVPPGPTSWTDSTNVKLAIDAEVIGETKRSANGSSVETITKFGNKQLTLSMDKNGNLTTIHNGQRKTSVKKKALFSVTLATNVYGLDPAKRRTLKLKPIKHEGDLITLAPEKEALPRFTFRTIDKGSYFILELVSMENPAKEHADVLTMQLINGTNWMPLDGVTKKSYILRNNPSFFGVLRRSEKNSLGSIAMWSPKNNEDDDETLYQVWANENMPHPKVDGEWTVARAKQWISDYINIVCKEYKTQMYIGPRRPEDLKLIAEEAKRFGIKKLYMHLNTWGNRYWAADRDNFELNEKIFPNGREDMIAFGKYLKENGMQLTLRTTSYSLGNKHPDYLGKVPHDDLATWWQGTLAEDVDAKAKELTVTEGREHTTEYPAGQGDYIKRNCMRIGDELVTFGQHVDNGDGTWTLKGCRRGFGLTDAVSHSTGEKVRGLYRVYGIAFAPDPDSSLLGILAKRFGEFHNDVSAGTSNFDALEVHTMMFSYGETKFMGEVYRHIDHPVMADTSGGDMTWGFIEPKFHAVQNALDPTKRDRPNGIPYYPDMKIGMHTSHWAATGPYAYCYAIPARTAAGMPTEITAQDGFHDMTMERFKGHGLIDHYVKNYKQWCELGFGLPQEIKKRIFSSWYKNSYPPYRFSLIDEVFRFKGEGDALSVEPFRVMKRKGIDRGWTYHQEHGTIYPYQYIRPGQTAISVNNPYHRQVPEFIIRVMPDFNRDIASMRLTAGGETKDEKAFNDMLDRFQGASGVKLEEQAAADLSGKNVSYRVMPDPKTIKAKGEMLFTKEGKGVRISCSNDTNKKHSLVDKRSANLPYYGVKTDITKAGGLAMVVTGDGSGAILVVRISGQGSRDYIVHLDFKGKRYIEIPSPQVSWADARWPFFDAFKRWRGNSISRIYLGIDRVKANSKASVLLEDLRFLPEKTSALVNPSINVGKGSIAINGTVPSDRYLWYQGGDEVGVYDLNWNEIETFPVTLNDAEAVSGDVDMSVTNHSKDGDPWLETQFFVKDKGMPVKKQPDLAVATYAPGSDSAKFRWPTHIAFGPGNQEIVTDLKK